MQQVIDERGSATLIGIVTLIWSASGVFDVLQVSFDRTWHVSRPPAFWLQRLFSIAVIRRPGLVLFGERHCLILFPDARPWNAWSHKCGKRTGDMGWECVGGNLAFIAFLMLYKTFPHADVKWKHAFLGGLVAAVLWQTAKYLQLYLVHFPRFNLVYGSGGRDHWAFVVGLYFGVGSAFGRATGGDDGEKQQRKMVNGVRGSVRFCVTLLCPTIS